MITTARKLEVIITGDSAQLERALMRGGSAAEGFGHKLEKMAKVAVLAAGAAGIGALAYGLDKSVKAAMAAETSTARMDQAFKNVGLSAGKSAKQIDQAEKAGRKLGFTNTETRQVLGSLVTATGNMAKASTDLGVAQDIARFKGVDLADASKMLTMAMTGSQRAAKQLGITVIPVTSNLDALKRAHVDLTSASGKLVAAHAKLLDKEATGQAVIDAVTAKVKGQAAAFAGTGSGGIAVFKANLEGLEESIGAKLLPALSRAVGFVNDHWPEISRVADQVGQAIQTGIGAAASFVQQHWETIKSVGVGAFNTLKSVAQGFVSFMSSSWGQSIAIGAGILLGLVKTIQAVKVAVAAARIAMLAFASTPMGLLFAGLSIAAGYAITQLIQMRAAMQNLHADLYNNKAAVDSLVTSLQGLKNTIDALDNAHLSLKDAQIQLQASLAQLHGSAVAWHKDIADGTTKTAQGVQDYIAYRTALQAVARAHQQVGDSQASVNRLIREGQITVQSGTAAFKNLGNFYTELWGKVSSGDITVDQFESKMADLTTKVLQSVGAHEKLASQLARSNPKMAEAQAQTARYGQAVLNVIRKHEAFTTANIVSELRKIPWGPFEQKLLGLPAKGKTSGDATSKGFMGGVGKIVAGTMGKVADAGKKFAGAVGPARAGGRSAGAAWDAGVGEGMAANIGAVIGAAVNTLRAATAAAGGVLHGSGPFHFTNEAIGVPLMQGVAEGIAKSVGLVASALRVGVKSPLDDPAVKAEIAAASKVLGAGAVKGITDGIMGVQQSMKQQLIAAMKDAVHQAIVAAAQQVATDKGTLASALSSLGGNVMSAAGALGPNFGTAATRAKAKKAADEQAAIAAQQQAEQEAQLNRAIVAAQTQLQTDTSSGTATPEQIAADKQAVADAIQQLADFQAAQQQAADQKAADEAQKRDRDNLEKQWANLEKEIKAHPERAAKIRAQIDQLLAKYGITPASVTNAADWQTAQTLFVSSLGDVVSSMRTLTASIDKLAGLRSSASASAAPPSGGLPHHAMGGATKSGLAILHDGEYVLNPGITKKIGIPALNRLNFYGHFAKGGPVLPPNPHGPKNPHTGTFDTEAFRAAAMWINDYGDDKEQSLDVSTALLGSFGPRAQIQAALRPTTVDGVSLRRGDLRGGSYAKLLQSLRPTWEKAFPDVVFEDGTPGQQIPWLAAASRLPAGGQELGGLIASSIGVSGAASKLERLLSHAVHRGNDYLTQAQSKIPDPHNQRNNPTFNDILTGNYPALASGGRLLADGLYFGHRGETVTPAKVAPLGGDRPMVLHATFDFGDMGRRTQTFLIDEKRNLRPGIDG